MKKIGIISLLFFFLLVINMQEAKAQNFDRSVRVAENFEPTIPHPDQDKEVAKKLKDLEKEIGKKPNIVWLIVDDMGYGDPGCYGGGAAIGAATPNMDKIAAEGLKLTSCYLHCKHTANLSENIIIVVSDDRFVVNRAIPVI